MKTAVVFITHHFDAELARRYTKLKSESPEGASVFLMAEKGTAIPDSLSSETHGFEFSRLRKRPAKVIGDRLVPGNVHLAFLDFYEAHRGFDHYWFIEYDVVFNGSWRTLFDAVGRDRSDLVAGNVRALADQPGWFWWPFMDFPDGPDKSAWLGAFFPLCRISRAALEAVAARVGQRWTGHHEGLIPTAVCAAGLSVSDVGGDGPWTPDDRRRRFYTSVSTSEGEMLLGTLRAAPPHFLPYLLRDVIYHPVKGRRLPNLGDLRKMRQRYRLLLRRGVASAWAGTYWRLIARPRV
ncbi:MAG: hypothetical protein Q8T11_08195 [Elusimicrobiota bacterium]|nr:hypothetical protein [Elusimicrobiota bacterium]